MSHVGYFEVATRWVAVAMGRTDKPLLTKNPRMPNNSETIDSYGAHFHMAFVARRRGKFSHFVLNGDRWGPTTDKHQREIRSAVERAGAPFVIIPFSVLDEAGIVPTDVDIVENTPERTARWVETRTEMPEDIGWGDYVVTDKRAEYGYMDGDGNPWVDRFHTTGFVRSLTWQQYLGFDKGIVGGLKRTLIREDQERRGKHYGITVPAVTHTERALLQLRGPGKGSPQWKWRVSHGETGVTTYSREHFRHWLGESLVKATVQYRVTRSCRACGGHGIRPGIDIPWDEWITDRDRPQHRDSLCSVCQGRRTVTTNRTRRAFFLSGFDSNETRPSYFFAELPKGARPTTVAEAYEALKPEAVKLAEAAGREVRRQGDIFAVEVSLITRELTKQGGRIVKGGYILGTNHVVTEQIVTPDGLTFGRGTLTHRPEFRRPDHRRVTLGKRWHLLTKNMVPTA